MASNRLKNYTDLRRVIDRVDPGAPSYVPESERPIARFIDGGRSDSLPSESTKDKKAAAWSWIEIALAFFAALIIAFSTSLAVGLARRAVRNTRLHRELRAERHRKILATAPRRAPPATTRPGGDRSTAERLEQPQEKSTDTLPKHDRRIWSGITS